MSQRTRKAQVLFTPEEYSIIEEEARRQGKAVGVIIREAAQRYVVYDIQQERKKRALAEMFAMALPVADWEEMEQEIMEGALSDGCLP